MKKNIMLFVCTLAFAPQSFGGVMESLTCSEKTCSGKMTQEQADKCIDSTTYHSKCLVARLQGWCDMGNAYQHKSYQKIWRDKILTRLSENMSKADFAIVKQYVAEHDIHHKGKQSANYDKKLKDILPKEAFKGDTNNKTNNNKKGH